MMGVSFGLASQQANFNLWFGAAFAADALGSLGHYYSISYLSLLGRLTFGGLALTGVVLLFLQKR
jgi:uncharacterized membrane protein YjjB (DUF3815 family)